MEKIAFDPPHQTPIGVGVRRSKLKADSVSCGIHETRVHLVALFLSLHLSLSVQGPQSVAPDGSFFAVTCLILKSQAKSPLIGMEGSRRSYAQSCVPIYTCSLGVGRGEKDNCGVNLSFCVD